MNTLYLVAGCRAQEDSPAAARHLYQGELFNYGLQYAEKVAAAGRVFILSAKYGVVRPDDIIRPYQVSFLALTPGKQARRGGRAAEIQDKRSWRSMVAQQLSAVAKLDQDKFVILAGKDYAEQLGLFLAHTEEPLKGLNTESRVKLLQRKIVEEDYRRGRSWAMAQQMHAAKAADRRPGFWSRVVRPLLNGWWPTICETRGAKNISVDAGTDQQLPPAEISGKRILLIGGSVVQKDTAAPARELYLAERFQFTIQHVDKFNVSKIFVLSAKYGLVEPDQVIEPYNLIVKSSGNLSSKQRANVQPMDLAERNAWTQQIIGQLSKVADLQRDTFVLMGGKDKWNMLRPFILHLEGPGEEYERAQKAYLIQRLKERAERAMAGFAQLSQAKLAASNDSAIGGSLL